MNVCSKCGKLFPNHAGVYSSLLGTVVCHECYRAFCDWAEVYEYTYEGFRYTDFLREDR